MAFLLSNDIKKKSWKGLTLNLGDVYFEDPYLALQFQSGPVSVTPTHFLNK